MASIHIGCWVSNEKAAAEKEVAERRRRVKVVLIKKAAVENAAQNKIIEIWSS